MRGLLYNFCDEDGSRVRWAEHALIVDSGARRTSHHGPRKRKGKAARDHGRHARRVTDQTPHHLTVTVKHAAERNKSKQSRDDRSAGSHFSYKHASMNRI